MIQTIDNDFLADRRHRLASARPTPPLRSVPRLPWLKHRYKTAQPPCRTPRRRLRSHPAGTTVSHLSLVKTTSPSLAGRASRRASCTGPSRSLRRQCPPPATGCGASRWQTRQVGRGHPLRGRRMARPGGQMSRPGGGQMARPSGASELCILFCHRRRQPRHVRISRRCQRGKRSTCAT